MEEIERHELKPGEVCPYCGQKKRGGYNRSEAARAASLANLAKRTNKGGRPKGSKNKPKPEI